MRHIRSILFSLVLAGISLSASTVTPFAQEVSEDRQSWDDFANGRTDFEVSDPALLPEPLVLAVKQTGCDYTNKIKDIPVHFIEVNRSRLALVFCSAFLGWHQVYDLSPAVWLRPRLMAFPVAASDSGFGVTFSPGFITWNKESGFFEAVTVSDVCSVPRLRHTYRLDRDLSFVVVRVEIGRDHYCGASEWTEVWQAPLWPAFPSRSHRNVIAPLHKTGSARE